LKRTDNFDNLAWCYDHLAKAVFGKRIVAAQTFYLNRIRSGSSVLILGGGTGWIIEELLSRTNNCTIWYIEWSQEMLRRARRYNMPGRTNFIHGTEEDIPAKRFDAVITNFYLDLFSDKKLPSAISEIAKVLGPDAVWLASDFIMRKWWHKLLLWIMYRFFSIFCRIGAHTLPNWEEAILKLGFSSVSNNLSCGTFIKSVVYQRRNST
jgi:ubiquinone/menaquinone biosynthesis C-methylase UbiE